jgi:hypothetical protein
MRVEINFKVEFGREQLELQVTYRNSRKEFESCETKHARGHDNLDVFYVVFMSTKNF